jgi:hypothetical protein
MILIKALFRKATEKIARIIASQHSALLDAESLNQQIQLSLKNQWLQWKLAGSTPYSRIRDAGFRCYSESEEDGIILYLLTMIGVDGGTLVEMCCGSGNECMATNLILNHGYKGFLFDGSEANIDAATRFFHSKKDCRLVKPDLSCTWITVENVNALLTRSGCPRDVDFFSLDIDGNDYWVWDAVEAINPKVCCIETLDIAPSNKRITMPYDPKFSLGAQPPQLQDFRSGSLAAMVKLSKRKGYRLVGAHRHGFNAFFMRNDIGMDFFPEVSVVDVHNNPWTKYGQSQRWETVKNLGWVEV